MNKKLNPGKLLDDFGNLSECGYATSFIKDYDRNQIKASKWRIKERDYYYVGDDEYGIALTIDDNGYMGLCSLSILNFKTKKYLNNANMFWFPFGKVKMPSTSKTGDVSYSGKGYKATFLNNNGSRILKFDFDNVEGKKFNCEFLLELTSNNSLVIATPFTKKKHFYYNQKINNMRVSGTFTWGETSHEFSNNAFGCLDWGRGVWTYKNNWYWSSMSGKQDGNLIGFNLGYGFGDTSAASENILFVNDKAYKLDDVIFNIPKDKKGKEKYLETWKVYSSDGKIDLKFEPILDRHDCTNALIIAQDAHQVFGKFSGKFIVENGQEIIINNMIGFAEKVKNKW